MDQKVSASQSAEYRLSKQDLDFYKENGFIVVRGLIDQQLLLRYKQHFEDICNSNSSAVSVVKEVALIGKDKKLQQYVNKIQDILNDEVYMTYSENPKILNIVSQFIGDELTAVNLMLINKPPGSTRHPTHQDLYYFPFRPVEKIIGIWTALDSANLENGCLYVVPGSHKIGKLLKHENSPGDKKKFFHCVVDEDIYAPQNKRLNLVMNPGDTVFFHPYLMHGSGPNLTKDYRKALTVHYSSNSCYYIDLAGTVQDDLNKEFLKELEQHGIRDVTFGDLWKFKSKVVKETKSHL